MKLVLVQIVLILLIAGSLAANQSPIDPSPGGGPFSISLDDPNNPWDAPIPGFVGPDGIGKANIDDGVGFVANPDNYVNPLFFGWADSVAGYSLIDDPDAQALYDFMYDYDPGFVDPANILGPVTGDVFDIVSLGDTWPSEWPNDSNHPTSTGPGTITVVFDEPIRDMTGADFTVFENGFVANSSTVNGTVAGEISAELVYVEVSADGVNFVRFPSASLTSPGPFQNGTIGPYATIDSSQVYNLAGKHSNAYGFSWGTPFDIAQVGLSQVTHIRLVDIPGTGLFSDNATGLTDPATDLPFSTDHPIYDAWWTWGSGGADIEAIGAISQQMTYLEWPQLQLLTATDRDPGDDPENDGLTNLEEYAFAMLPWKAQSEVHPCHIAIVEKDGERRAEFTFRRDERLTDLTYKVWVTDSLLNPEDWELMASSTGGQPLVAVEGMNPEISETSDSEIASIGVIRRVTVRDTKTVAEAAHRFFKVEIVQQDSS
ncbi:MAG: hypothetical protein AAGJ81_00820 [Verrucomicrobiota bacterium]